MGNIANLNRKLRVRGFDMHEREFHHWNYNYPNSGFVLDRRLHSLIHLYLKYDELSKCFFYNDSLLNTKEDHMKAIRKILIQNNIRKSIIQVEIEDKKIITYL